MKLKPGVIVPCLIIAGILIFTACNKGLGTPRIDETVPQVTMDIRLRLRPVHLFYKNSFVGNATMETDDQGNPLRFITATHVLLGTSPRKKYEYRIVLPNGQYGGKGTVSGFKADLIKTLRPGLFADVAVSSVLGGDANGSSLTDIEWFKRTGHEPVSGAPFQNPVIVHSRVSGAKASMIGAFVTADGRLFYLLVYAHRGHESGTGFVNEDSGDFYVLNGTLPIGSEIRRSFRIPEGIESVSLLTPVNLGGLL